MAGYRHQRIQWLRDAMIDIMPSNIGYDQTFIFLRRRCYLSNARTGRVSTSSFQRSGGAHSFTTQIPRGGGNTVFESRTATGTQGGAALHHQAGV
jgi:hypothetical protein